MGKRKRVQRVKVGELSTLIKEQQNKYARSKQMYAEVVQDIMKENKCSWTEAKQIYKFRKISQGIKREINSLTFSHS